MTIQAQKATISEQRSLAGLPLVLVVACCIGFTIMGDALMYAILPLAAPALGIALPLVGVLLSANRLVRLLSNAPAARIFERIGPRIPFIGSVAIGAGATLLYGVPAGFVLFLVARLIWGIAWSGMRQGGYQAVWTGALTQKGRLTGILWGLVSLGSTIGVLVGGFLYDRSGYHAAILFVIVMAVLAVPVALFIRWPAIHLHLPTPSEELQKDAAGGEGSDGSWTSVWKSPVQRWLVIAGFFQLLLSGVIVSTTAIFVAIRLGTDSELAWLGIGVATLTGIIHGVRWIADLALGPAMGALSDKVGQPTTSAIVVVIYAAAIVGALTLPPAVAILCLFLVLLSDGAMTIVTTAGATGVAISTKRPHAFVGVFTTTTDAGSALGPLVAYSLVTTIGLSWVYGVLGLCLFLTVMQYWRYAHNSVYALNPAR